MENNMFETTVKHFVYDFCIGLVFDKWKDNFVSASGDMPKVGDIFNRISHMMEDEHYYKCKVRNVVPKHTKDGKPYCLVYLNYEHHQELPYRNGKMKLANI